MKKTNEEKIEKFKQQKMKYELLSAQYLMKANDIDEKITKLLPRQSRVGFGGFY